MAVEGRIDPKFRELNEARESLLRELERLAGETNAQPLLARIERLVFAMISTGTNQRY